MLKASEIYKSYNKPILCGLDFCCEQGSIVGIAGKNGSGKSTLLSIITSIINTDKGTVTLNDENLILNYSLMKKSLSFVPQENSLYENLSVKDNLKFWASAVGKKPNLENYDKDLLRKKIKQLSGGMKRMLSIDIALLNDPLYLIMDEPTAALDIAHKQSIMNIILKRKNENKSVIFTSHQTDELLMCDKIYIIKDGVFVYGDSPLKLNEHNNFKNKLLELTI